MRISPAAIVGAACVATRSAYALEIDTSDVHSITTAAKSIASRVFDIYHADSAIPGIFPQPYYWWESGLAWDTMINYWALTGDDTYNDLVGEGILFQTGPENNFMPPNQSASLGNDDQSFWALAAMTAAERDFPKPAMSYGKNVSWVQLAQNVFDTQVARWDDSTCGGGLRWQIFTFNAGYRYKNSLTNGNFVQLAARLERYTGNSTYRDWAEKAIQWSFDVGMISNDTDTFAAVWDGTDTSVNCSTFNHIQWTASTGTYLAGSAYAENATSSALWIGFTFALFGQANYTFAKDNTLVEVACEPNDNCNTDQLAFKGILARALATTRDLTWDNNITRYSSTDCAFMPWNKTCVSTNEGTIHGRIDKILQTSARGAAKQCSGGESGTVCGSDWTSSTWDGSSGLGQELNAMEAMLAILPGKAALTMDSTMNATAPTSSIGGSGSNGTVTPGRPGGVAGGATPSNSAIPSNGATGTASASMFALAFGLAFATALFL